MRVLVTGAGGFVGRHLICDLIKNGHEVIAFDVDFPDLIDGISEHVAGNILDAESLKKVVSSTKPDSCVHLAAISFAPAAKDNAQLMFSVNVVGTLNLLEAFRKNAPSARILTISTAHVYAGITSKDPIKEDDSFAPLGLYAISKAAADKATLEYSRLHNMHTMTARPNNHIGPGQSPVFVIASFAEQLKKMAGGSLKGSIHVGNMESMRDFSDVRDVVSAYRLLLEKGKPGRAYNISSGNMLSIRAVFDELCNLARVWPDVVVDKERYRPTDSSPLLELGRIRQDTGWKPGTPLSQTLGDILAEF